MPVAMAKRLFAFRSFTNELLSFPSETRERGSRFVLPHVDENTDAVALIPVSAMIAVMVVLVITALPVIKTIPIVVPLMSAPIIRP